MNKEILQKLADQAAVNDMVNNFNGEDYTVRMPSETWAREFAKLIIAKCVEISDDYSDSGIIPTKINKYFGVEQ